MSRISLPLCECNKTVVLKTSWTDEDPGRRFETCAKLGRGVCCAHWNWFDPETCPRSKQVIPGLLQLINEKDEIIEELLEEKADLWSTNEQLRGEIVALEEGGAVDERQQALKEIEDLKAQLLKLQINCEKGKSLEREVVHMKVRSALISVAMALCVMVYGWYLFVVKYKNNLSKTRARHMMSTYWPESEKRI
ncbi:hypothetical protein OROHE_006622 [Orobanche hederae]